MRLPKPTSRWGSDPLIPPTLLARGDGDDLETVEAGWQVYKDLYGDTKARLFIYFTPDAYGDGGCYNLNCDGFIQIDSSVYIGGSWSNYSSIGGTQYATKLLLYKDNEGSGHWWLKYGDKWIGYWPKSLFDSEGIGDHGSMVDYGGEILNQQFGGIHTDTDMGSGRFPDEGFGKAAYQRNILYVNTNNYYREPRLRRDVTDRDCYDLDLKNYGSWDRHFYFGGPGSNDDCY